MAQRFYLTQIKWLVLIVALALPVHGQAQNAVQRIFSLSQERLYNQSEFGLRIGREIEKTSSEIANENRRIEAELKQEEQSLTDKRASLSPVDFRVLADAFDRKVETIRAEQAKKSLALTSYAESEQQRFFKEVFPVLVALAEELDAAAILDERLTIISSDRIDITQLAITRVNSAIGGGVKPADP